MKHRFRYKMDSLSRVVTIAIIIALLTLSCYIIYIGLGSYVTAWILTIIASITSIYILSVPRYIDVSDNSIEIHCLLELTAINIEDIESIRLLDNKQMSRSIPVWGSFGFLGYYGYYVNFKSMELIKVYTLSWGNFIEILDLYGQKYIISCANPQEFVDLVLRAKSDYMPK